MNKEYKKLNKILGTKFKSNEQVVKRYVTNNLELTDENMKMFHKFIDWEHLLSKKQFDEDFLEKCYNYVHSGLIYELQSVSEDFIERHENDANWNIISRAQHLSEYFIEKHDKQINWNYISQNQKLSEDFIERNFDRLDIINILIYQKISENFIERHDEMLYSPILFTYQNLSETFIKKVLNLNKKYRKELIVQALRYQKLSKKFAYKLLLEVFCRRFFKTEYKDDKKALKCLFDNWIYKSAEEKKQAVIKTGLYECHEDYFIAYKAIRIDRYSLFNFQYKYEPGGVYESWCDCSNAENSFGLNVGTERYAYKYGNNFSSYKVVHCQIYYKDIGRVVHKDEKIRCLKIKILD